MNTIEQKARELMNDWFADSETVKSVDVYGALIEMGEWYEKRIKDYLVKRVESIDDEDDFKEKQIIGGIYKDLFEV